MWFFGRPGTLSPGEFCLAVRGQHTSPYLYLNRSLLPNCLLRALLLRALLWWPVHISRDPGNGEVWVFVSIAGCADCQRRRCDLFRTTAFSHHDRHLQALPAVFARTSEAQRWLQDHVSPAVHSERASCEKSRFWCRLLAVQTHSDAVAIFSVPRRFPIMTGTSRPCQRYSRGPAKLKDGFRIMFRLLYRAFLLFFVVVLFF